MNVFEGGSLGLDNITVVDRGDRYVGGAILEQSHATAAGLGASHQAGWTGLVANLIDDWRRRGAGGFSWNTTIWW
ncbi:MAG: hypothetical protein HY237_10095 [Acidobacteria bacterium]|nr:hypothetical protein [Acidobacteriota bacterium]